MVFYGRGACSSKQKIVTLAEEVRRRLTNQDRFHSIEERLQELNNFSQKLIDSGYQEVNRKEILKSGISRYYRIRLLELPGVRKLYRSAADMAKARDLKPLKLKAWFKNRRGGVAARMFETNYPQSLQSALRTGSKKTVMFLGMTGTGKTTFIDALTNFTVG